MDRWSIRTGGQWHVRMGRTLLDASCFLVAGHGSHDDVHRLGAFVVVANERRRLDEVDGHLWRAAAFVIASYKLSYNIS